MKVIEEDTSEEHDILCSLCTSRYLYIYIKALNDISIRIMNEIDSMQALIDNQLH